MFTGPIVLKTEIQEFLDGEVRKAIDLAASLPRPEGATRLTVNVGLKPAFAQELGYQPYNLVRPYPLTCTVDLPPAETK